MTISFFFAFLLLCVLYCKFYRVIKNDVIKNGDKIFYSKNKKGTKCTLNLKYYENEEKNKIVTNFSFY